jgi:putative transposase
MDDIRRMLTDEIWAHLEAVITEVKSRAGAPAETSDREFVEAVLYRARTGIPWRDLPACFGAWDAVYQRFRRWEKTGVWQALFENMPDDAALEAAKAVFLDSTVIRAHPHAAGASSKKGGKKPRALAGVAEASARSSTWRQQTRKRPLLSS